MAPAKVGADAAPAEENANAAPALGPLMARYLEHATFEKRLATRTVTLYALDLQKLADACAAAGVAPEAAAHHHIRRFVAQMHAGGRSARGIALILSGWRGFYAWLGREGRIGQNPVLHVRAHHDGLIIGVHALVDMPKIHPLAAASQQGKIYVCVVVIVVSILGFPEETGERIRSLNAKKIAGQRKSQRPLRPRPNPPRCPQNWVSRAPGKVGRPAESQQPSQAMHPAAHPDTVEPERRDEGF
ncbi:MAG: hypothetical protein EOO59_11260 [Hymenobacter sp.]|nr:MAG: hypothetical protein EOO59_11260 [Hymenobacter sp.]